MPRKLTTDEFITKANLVHKNKFTYLKTIYISTLTKIIITCPWHGDFEQAPAAHLNGHECAKCWGYYKSTDKFISEANKIHNNKYNYSLVSYRNATTKIIIGCEIHGNFEQTPHNHLSGNGCPKCYGMKKTTEEFII